MSSSKFATLLKVRPPPSTLAESSAIYKHLKSKGRLTTFIKNHVINSREKSIALDLDYSTASYYAVFAHEPPGLQLDTTFEVPVHQSYPLPRDEDPYNIRGLQDRKPFPDPITFTCHLQSVKPHVQQAIEEDMRWKNPFRDEYKTIRTDDDWLQMVFKETGASPGIVKGLGHPVKSFGKQTRVGEGKRSNGSERGGRREKKPPRVKEVDAIHPPRKRKLRMDSLIKRNDDA